MLPIEILPISKAFLSGGFALLGLTIGSFLNVVIHRLPKISEREIYSECYNLTCGKKIPAYRASIKNIQWFNRRKWRQGPDRTSFHFKSSDYSLSVPESHCPHCFKSLKLIDNIPLISFTLLKGKCRYCHKSISIRYPFVELISSLGAFYIAMKFGVYYDFGTDIFSVLKIAALCFFFWACIALTFIDIDTKTLPHVITTNLLWLGILFSISPASNISLSSSVLGAACGYISLRLIHEVYKLVTHKEGMGHGDFKLVGALCAWGGYEILGPLLLMSSLSGSIFGISLILLKKANRNDEIPFGPFLVASGFFLILI